MRHLMLMNLFVFATITVIGGHFGHAQAVGGSPMQNADSKPIRQGQPSSTGADAYPTVNLLPDFLPMAGRVQGVCAVGPQHRLSVTSTPIAEWIAALRLRPHPELVEAGEKALPILTAAIQDPQASHYLVLTLNFDETDGKWLIPVYIAGLSHPGRWTPDECLRELSEFGHLVQPFVPAILDMLREPGGGWDDCPGLPVLEFLDKIGASNAQYLELAHLLFDRTLPEAPLEIPLYGERGNFDPDQALKPIISVGPPSLPVLLEIIRENKGLPDERARDLFHSRLWRLDADFQPGILAELKAQEADRRRAAAWLISMQSDPYYDRFLSQSVLAELVHHINDDDAAVRRYILQVFERQVLESLEAVPALVAQLTDADPANGRQAGRALGKIGTPALAEIRKAAASDNLLLRLNGTIALASIDALSASEVALLATLARDPDLQIRTYALWGLRRASEVTPELIEALSAALTDPATCRTAVATIAQIGPPALATLPLLVGALGKSPPEYQVSLASAIWQIDPESTLVIPTLIALLTSNQDTVASVAAALALGEMKSAAKPAVGALVSEIASNRPMELRSAAMRALAEIDPAAKEALPPLTKIATEEEGWFFPSRAPTAPSRIVPASSSADHPDELSRPRLVRSHPPQVKRRVPHRDTPED